MTNYPMVHFILTLTLLFSILSTVNYQSEGLIFLESELPMICFYLVFIGKFLATVYFFCILQIMHRNYQCS